MSKIRRGLAAVIAVVALAGSLNGQVLDDGRGYPAEDWPLVSGNWSSSRYSALIDITIDSAVPG